jgi:hypothetical protein
MSLSGSDNIRLCGFCLLLDVKFLNSGLAKVEDFLKVVQKRGGPFLGEVHGK